MNFVEPTVTPIPSACDSSPESIMKVIERAYRICYKSEANMKEGSEELIGRILHGGEKGKMIHSSPLEHRRILMSCHEWVAGSINKWQKYRGTSFIEVSPKPISEQHIQGYTFYLEGNLRSFFDFIDGYEDDYKVSILPGATKDDKQLANAKIVLNNTLSEFFPIIFKKTDLDPEGIEWTGASYLMESDNYMSFHVVTTRDILQEIARNRTISPNVESTRYCNYSKKGMSFCYPRPYEWSDECTSLDTDSYYQPPSRYIFSANNMSKLFSYLAEVSEMAYNKALDLGAKPQEARMLLLGGLKTEMILTGRYCDWAHFLKLRNDSAAHPQMIFIAKQIEEWFQKNTNVDIRTFDKY